MREKERRRMWKRERNRRKKGGGRGDEHQRKINTDRRGRFFQPYAT